MKESFKVSIYILTIFIFSGCVVDRTGQSTATLFQKDLAVTHTQVQGLQRTVDDQLLKTSARLVEVEESAHLNRRNLADSAALMDTTVSEIQGLRGTFEEVSSKSDQNIKHVAKFQEDVDFRLREIERRLTLLEKNYLEKAQHDEPNSNVASKTVDNQATNDKLTSEELLKKCKVLFDTGDYKSVVNLLKDISKKFPLSNSSKEEAIFVLADSLLKTGELRQSIQVFQLMVDEFPKSTKIPSAMLKQGDAFLSLGEKEDAKVFYSELIRAYSKTQEADSAKARLKQLK